MSGHSKWHNIKLKKGKVDAQRGALFTKLSKEIILAAKGGSPDPEANYRLKMAVEKAREFNMPQENIKRAIARGSGQTGEREIEEIRYEGYGPHGLAVVVDAATDNRNRTAGELRFLFKSTAERWAKPAASAGCSMPVGILEAEPAGKSEDAFTEACAGRRRRGRRIRCRSIDVIYTRPGDAGRRSRRVARAPACKIVRRLFRHARQNQSRACKETQLAAALAFLEALDEHEDVQRVFSNLDLSERVAGGTGLSDRRESLAARTCRATGSFRSCWRFSLRSWCGSGARFTISCFRRRRHGHGSVVRRSNAAPMRTPKSGGSNCRRPSSTTRPATAIRRASSSCSGPTPGEQVREGRQISFVISDGIVARLMPDLRYQSMREVQFDLSRSHLRLGKVTYVKERHRSRRARRFRRIPRR